MASIQNLTIPLILASIALITAACTYAPSAPGNGGGFSQDRCVGDATKLACTTNTIVANDTTGTLETTLINAAGSTINITGVSTTSSGSCALQGWNLLNATSHASIKGAAIPPDGQFLFDVTCGPQKPGSVFWETFTFHYDIVGGINNLQGQIEIVKNI